MSSLTELYKISSFLSIGGFISGYHTGVISGVFLMNAFNCTFSNNNRDVRGEIVGFLLLGCVAGALLAGKTSDWLSRKYSIGLFSVIFFVSIIVQTATSSLVLLLISRVFSGMTVGAFSVIVPVYLSEIATKEHRGRIVSFQQLGITIGIGISFWIDYALISHPPSDGWSWRTAFILQIAPALIFGVGILFCPFSPRWLMSKGREADALNVLTKIRAADPSDIQAELDGIKRELLLESETQQTESSFLFRNPTFLRRMILGIGIQIFQQFSGINFIIYYTPEIFKNLDFNNAGDIFLLSTGVNGFVNIIFTIPTVLLIDKVGRRLLFLSGAIIMAISMLIAGIAMSIYNGGTYPAAIYIVIMGVYVFVAAFAFSWGPVMWVYSTELCPLSMRAKGTAIMLAINWAANCGLSFLIPILFARLSFGIYIMFGIFCVIIGVSTFLFYPETKGIPLEKIDRLFRGPILVYSLAKINARDYDDLDISSETT